MENDWKATTKWQTSTIITGYVKHRFESELENEMATHITFSSLSKNQNNNRYIDTQFNSVHALWTRLNTCSCNVKRNYWTTKNASLGCLWTHCWCIYTFIRHEDRIWMHTMAMTKKAVVIRFNKFCEFNHFTTITRPHQLHAVHRCGPLLQMSHVAWSVCWAHGWAVQKRWINRDAVWRADSYGSKNHVLDWVPDPHGKGDFWGASSGPL